MIDYEIKLIPHPYHSAILDLVLKAVKYGICIETEVLL